MGKILKFGALVGALPCGAVYYAVQGGSKDGSVSNILKCDHLYESYTAVLSCGTEAGLLKPSKVKMCPNNCLFIITPFWHNNRQLFRNNTLDIS